jgi:hypothetical protein
MANHPHEWNDVGNVPYHNSTLLAQSNVANLDAGGSHSFSLLR